MGGTGTKCGTCALAQRLAAWQDRAARIEIGKALKQIRRDDRDRREQGREYGIGR